MKNGNNHGFWYAFNLTAIILIIFFVFAVPFLYAFVQFAQSVDLKATQTQGDASLLLPTTFTVEIENTSKTPLNAVEFQLHYDPKALMVTQITPLWTLCEERFIITNTINNASGTAFFQCGTVTPFSEVSGVIAIIHTIPLASGTSSVSFGTQTHVLAHDGYGTNVTKETHDLIFTTL